MPTTAAGWSLLRQANRATSCRDDHRSGSERPLIVATGPAGDRPAVARQGPQRGRGQSHPRRAEAARILCAPGAIWIESTERCRGNQTPPNASLVNCWAPSTRPRRQFQPVAACGRFEQARQVAGSGCLKEPVFALAGDCRRARTGSSPLLEFQTDPLLVLPLSIGMSPAYASRVAATARPS
jgi:hypothetical protein